MAKVKLSAKQRAVIETHKPIPTLKDVQKMLERNPTFYRELELARKRVGLESVDRVRWLLDFVSKDIKDLSQGQATDIKWEILGFSTPLKFETPPKEYGSSWFWIRNLQYLDQLEASGKEINRDDNLGWLSIEAVHSQLKKELDGFFDYKDEWTSGWMIIRPKVKESMGFDIRSGTTSHFVYALDQYTVDYINLINVWAFDLVHAAGEQLGVCKNTRCQRRFIAIRKGRAKFCSARCSAYVRITNARKARKTSD
ncbi:MAG: hypothetical protein O7B35_18940 [Deltaproteobacteria bacterium]|nr:hypothetical protein [Deltaproteobacteria bacterium]